MLYNTTKRTVLLILIAMTTDYGFSEDKKTVELKLSVFPETVAIGDTCYVLVTAINHYGIPTTVIEPEFQYPIIPGMVQFRLNHREKVYRGTFEALYYRSISPGNPKGTLIPSGEAVTFIGVPLQFPPLEDLYQDVFWEKVWKELKENPEGLSFEFGIEFVRPWMEGDKVPVPRARLTKEVTIKLRNEKEMAMIDQWYHNTPSEFFPGKIENLYLSKVPLKGIRKVSKKKILGQNPWKFINMGNRYPSDPNAPETWQGWQELEECLTPSTMRDEIRLSRILIQYCDTKDEAILKELKDWFNGMNEVQRMVMAKSLRDRVSGFRTTNLFPLIQEVYNMVREYDVVAISESREKLLQNLKLIE